MDTIQLLSSAAGLGLVGGVRLYATVLVVGLGVRYDLIHLTPGLSELRVLADTRVLAAAGIAYALEFIADKIPWVDSLWDTIHTLIRPVGAAMLAAAALGDFDPVTRTILVILCGGIGLSGHSTKAATRLVVNHSPEPFSNIALSLAEDFLVAVGAWLSIAHPLLMLGVVAAFLAIFAWLSPKIFRLLRLEIVALWAVGRKYLAPSRPAAAPVPPVYSDGPLAKAMTELESRIQNLPEMFRGQLGRPVALPCVKCAATKSVGGLRNSMGYLCFDADGLVFVARRGFRFRVVTIALTEISGASLRRGLLLDRLDFKTGVRERSFHVFKSPDA
ncbi:MAG: DUF4126 domain-containing protein [Bryobacterales bacterium]|nr:DUF4126 domain-containing protein [Bryobacterales bacterium]